VIQSNGLLGLVGVVSSPVFTRGIYESAARYNFDVVAKALSGALADWKVRYFFSYNAWTIESSPRIFLVAPEDFCHLMFKDCRYARMSTSRWFHRYCLNLLGWSVLADDGVEPQPCEELCPAAALGPDFETLHIWADIVDVPNWFLAKDRGAPTCDEFAFALAPRGERAPGTEVFLYSNLAAVGSDTPERLLDCERVGRWLNCNCGICDSWKAMCGCSTSHLGTCTSSTGEQSDQLLQFEHCYLDCPGNLTSHRSPLTCINRGLVSVQQVGAAQDGLQYVTVDQVCYNSTPQAAIVHVKFVDEDVRPGFVTGDVLIDFEGPPVGVQFVNLY